MEFQNILLDITDGIATITFNRPKELNAVDPLTLKEFSQAIDAVGNENSVRVLILTGEGSKSFVAGADISVMVDLSPLELRAFSNQAHEVMFQLESLPVPVIACVNGYALGGGCEIALACDFIYASTQAKFGQPEITIGLIPGWGGTQRLSRIVGKGTAKEMCLTGEMIDAQKAQDLGIVTRVFPAEDLYAETLKTATKIASMGRFATRAVKQCIDKGFDADLRIACSIEADAFGYCVATADGKEGMTAFLEKRKPVFNADLS